MSGFMIVHKLRARTRALSMRLAWTLALPMCGTFAMSPVPDTSHDRVWTPLSVPFTCVGSIRPRNASEIKASNWTIGCEGLDRDFDRFEKFRDYIAPLGIKTIRLQAGWAKTEKEPGKYDFAWLDDIVDYACANGINVLLETGYGNPAYEGGGGHYLGGSFPTSETALVAWDRWVDEMSRRYKDKVRDWAMWNEPDLEMEWLPGGKRNKVMKKSPAAIAAFNIRTAKIVKRNIPDARIAGLSLANNDADFLDACLKAMRSDIALFTWIIYHGYCKNPDASYDEVERQKAVLRKYSSTCKMRQGENGCPSGWVRKSALSRWPWSEYTQAKWDMRRMLGDLGHDVESAVFTLSGCSGGENKTLLRRAKDKTVIDIKLAYYSVQNVASVFDCDLERCVDNPTISIDDKTIALYEYRRRGSGEPVYVFWEHGDLKKFDKESNPQCPSDSFQTRPVLFTLRRELKDPVWGDMLTGKIYEFPRKNILNDKPGGTWLCKMVPVYDSPCLLAERVALADRLQVLNR